MDASHPEIYLSYTAIITAAPQETVEEAGIEPGTAALQSGETHVAINNLPPQPPLCHHNPS
jgi:hypothetical protein